MTRMTLWEVQHAGAVVSTVTLTVSRSWFQISPGGLQGWRLYVPKAKSINLTEELGFKCFHVR